MEYKVKIRKNDTGEVKEFTIPREWCHDEWWLWNVGNFSCDCNRAIIFYEDNYYVHECSKNKFAILLPGSTGWRNGEDE